MMGRMNKHVCVCVQERLMTHLVVICLSMEEVCYIAVYIGHMSGVGNRNGCIIGVCVQTHSCYYQCM